MDKTSCNSPQDVEVRKGPWTMEEDLILINYIANHGEGVWNALAKAAGLKRTGKSCRLRWLNYLRPDVRRGNITPEEQLLIMELHAKWGNKWSKIAKHLPGRTDNEIKNYWRTRIQKHIKQAHNFQSSTASGMMCHDQMNEQAASSSSYQVSYTMDPMETYSSPPNNNLDAFSVPLAPTDNSNENYWSMEDLWSMQLLISNQVDERTIQKYEKEAKDKSRESWYMAYIMDTNEEERVKGKTVEVGRAHFETETTRFTILDAPGHKSYVPNMISGASQADIGVLVISARKGEFETGYERGGQTREHVLLAKTLGVAKLLVVVNKMDEPTVKWSKERYDEIESKMAPFLKASGYNVKKDVLFLPISGLHGINMKTRVDKKVCPWWNGPCLFESLDTIEGPPRNPTDPFRMPIIDKFKDMGTTVMGKVESGSVREGDSLWVMPNKTQVKVTTVMCDENKVKRAGPGENLRVRISGIEEEDIMSGFVLSSIAKPIPAVSEFVAQLQILELLDNAIFTAGYKAILHIHAVVEECEIIELLQQIDPKTRKPMKKKVLFVKNGAVILCRVQVNNLICIEKFSDVPQLGRFTLRTEGKTVAVGKVTDIPCASN